MTQTSGDQQGDHQDLLLVRHLTDPSYETCWHAMQGFTNNRDIDTPDECWLVEHSPVFTLGQAGKPEHILIRKDVPIVQTDRGGQVTYHGPGQLMMYWLVDIKRRGVGVRDFVSIMEQSVIELLLRFNIEAHLKDGAPGVYVNGAKISALGLRVRRGRTYHGLALNVDMDLTPFEWINPCGYAGLETCNMRQLTDLPLKMPLIESQLLEIFAQRLSYDTVKQVS
ncbi:Octanoyltransferase [BD1-7 clade bacterium]|uniref:Octanoyltransferase n=1 Tax=BD1-7 clade bacterium TaxID=2029982 RepID=A0A5S9QWQ7_9GAMM|nr:Octanoyltransferase [BD1-7 clade bacterium]